MNFRLISNLKGNRVLLLSGCFLFLITLIAVFAPWISPYPFDAQDISNRLQSPSRSHWSGTDTLGRDLLSRILFGAQMSLAVGYLTTLIALGLGLALGVAAGYFGGWIDRLIMRASEVVYSFPSVLTAILITLFFERSLIGILIAIALTSWVTHARIARAQTVVLKESAQIEGARAVGANSFRIISKHILPNIMGPLAVSVSTQIPANIMAESFLSFIGLGLQPPYSSWGTLANEGFRAMMSFPHLILFPGIALFVTTLAFNYFGDGIRDLLDPHQNLDPRQ